MTTKSGREFVLQNAKMLQLHPCLPRLGKRIYREIELGLLSNIQIVPRTQAIIKKCRFFLRKTLMKVYQRFSNSSKFVNTEDFSGLAITQTPNKDTSFGVCYDFANCFCITYLLFVLSTMGDSSHKTFLIRHKSPGNLGF